jgi:hypothetical protein
VTGGNALGWFNAGEGAHESGDVAAAGLDHTCCDGESECDASTEHGVGAVGSHAR